MRRGSTVGFKTQRWGSYFRLMRMDRPIGIWLLMYPTLWALWGSSNGRPDAVVFGVFVVGVVVMRAAGCVINDYADRKIDPHVQRTQDRPLASGEVSPGEALTLFVALMLIALLLVLFLDSQLLLLASAGAVLAMTYPFLKRYTHLPQFYLGVAFGWGIPMAYFAHLHALPAECWWLLGANVFWAAAYDTEYALVDRNDDLTIGVKSTAILFGEYDRLMVLVLHALTLVCLSVFGLTKSLGGWYWAGLFGAALIALYQQHLIKERKREECFVAFLNNNWFGAAIFFGLFLDYTLL
ncbi:MAG: 4-hydroxybenzoate octaprenyltransferase [Gammaproteobacteria bacterium]|nr:4-hydroxybenzoate octaprenyltransferase [Gammaproteobacteria bacterium]